VTNGQKVNERSYIISFYLSNQIDRYRVLPYYVQRIKYNDI